MTAPAHCCLAAPLSMRRRRREATDGRLESGGGASALLPRRAAVQRIAASPRRCPAHSCSPRCCTGGDRDERRRTGVSSREAAPAHSCLAAPPSSAQLLAAPLAAPLSRRR